MAIFIYESPDSVLNAHADLAIIRKTEIQNQRHQTKKYTMKYEHYLFIFHGIIVLHHCRNEKTILRLLSIERFY